MSFYYSYTLLVTYQIFRRNRFIAAVLSVLHARTNHLFSFHLNASQENLERRTTLPYVFEDVEKGLSMSREIRLVYVLFTYKPNYKA